MATRTSTLANIDKIRADYSNEAEVNEIIDLVESSVDDPMASDYAMQYGTKALYVAAGYTEEPLPFLKTM